MRLHCLQVGLELWHTDIQQGRWAEKIDSVHSPWQEEGLYWTFCGTAAGFGGCGPKSLEDSEGSLSGHSD